MAFPRLGCLAKATPVGGFLPAPTVSTWSWGVHARKLAEVDGRIEPRQMLSLTIIFDHDIIDGAPAARFTRKLVELIEAGYGLDEVQFFKIILTTQPTSE